MKNINIVSLLALLASAQIYGDANPELSLVLAYQAVDALNRNVASDNDDAGALKLLETIDECISFDIDNKKAVAATQGILFNTPLDQAKIDAGIKSLEKRIDTLDHNISEFKKGGIMPGERARIDKRRAERRSKKEALNAQEQARKDSQGTMDAAQKALASLQDSLASNELLFEQALESYILSFGQCFLKSQNSNDPNNIKGSIVISSKYDQSMPITAKEYNQLIATLNKAYNTFGAAATINLDLDNNNVANAQQVANYIKQVPLASAQSWAMFGAKAALGIGAAILATAVVTAAVVVGSNVYQNKNWNDTDDTMAAYNSGIAQGTQAYENAAEYASNSWANIASSSAGQSIYSFWNSLTGNQQEQTANELQNDANLQQVAAQALVNNDKDNLEQALASNDQDAIQDAQEQVIDGQNLLDEIEYQIENYGKPQLTDEENSKLAPYAAGALALGVGGIGAAIAADVVLGAGAAAAAGVPAGIQSSGTLVQGSGKMIAQKAVTAPVAATTGRAISPTWGENFSNLPANYVKTAPNAVPAATNQAASPNWAAYFEHLS